MTCFQGTARIVRNLAGPKNANAARKSKEKCRISKEPHALFGTLYGLKMLIQPVKVKRNAAYPRNRTHCSEPRRP